MKYRVLRQHYGDKEYREGDERELSATDAKQLVDMGVLSETKKAPEPSNKMQSEPENKARRSSKTKSED